MISILIWTLNGSNPFPYEDLQDSDKQLNSLWTSRVLKTGCSLHAIPGKCRIIKAKQLDLKAHSVFSSVAQSCLTLCHPMDCSMPGLPAHCQLPEFTQTHVHWVGDAIQPSHPLLSPSPPAFNISQHHGLFQLVNLRIRWPKYWSFSFSISPSNEYSGLISFRMDWLDLLAVQGTLKSLLQHHSSKASILRPCGIVAAAK